MLGTSHTKSQLALFSFLFLTNMWKCDLNRFTFFVNFKLTLDIINTMTIKFSLNNSVVVTWLVNCDGRRWRENQVFIQDNRDLSTARIIIKVKEIEYYRCVTFDREPSRTCVFTPLNYNRPILIASITCCMHAVVIDCDAHDFITTRNIINSLSSSWSPARTRHRWRFIDVIRATFTEWSNT